MPSALVSAPTEEQSLFSAIEPLRERLRSHPLYSSVTTLERLRLFMQSHVYAVWDFMSLLKSLQRALTCVDVPWLPTADASSRRLINEIVLGEESDVYEGEALSHFELYLRAMESCGAGTGPAHALAGRLAAGSALADALAPAPPEAAAFVGSTFHVIATAKPQRIAAAFTFGREDLIPDMFTAFVRELHAQLPKQIAPFRYYLERHIEMDGDEHGPMALQMMRNLCQTPRQWEEATEAAVEALQSRIDFWDAIHARIEASPAA